MACVLDDAKLGPLDKVVHQGVAVDRAQLVMATTQDKRGQVRLSQDFLPIFAISQSKGLADEGFGTQFAGHIHA
jgi:hypothetical protein